MNSRKVWTIGIVNSYNIIIFIFYFYFFIFIYIYFNIIIYIFIYIISYFCYAVLYHL
nr:MAG TPA: hypothetical protein [Caudoviricetes sp.]